MKLESPKVTAGKSQQDMFNFLTNVENYEQIMPESKEKFEVTADDTFLFQLKGMPEIKLKIVETKETFSHSKALTALSKIELQRLRVVHLFTKYIVVISTNNSHGIS